MLSFNVYTIDLIHVLWGWGGSSPSFWKQIYGTMAADNKSWLFCYCL